MDHFCTSRHDNGVVYLLIRADDMPLPAWYLVKRLA